MSSIIAFATLAKLGSLFSKKFATKRIFTALGIGITSISQYQKNKFYRDRSKYYKENERRHIDQRENNFEL